MTWEGSHHPLNGESGSLGLKCLHKNVVYAKFLLFPFWGVWNLGLCWQRFLQPQ